MYHIQLINTISPKGINVFSESQYTVSDTENQPHAIIVRSSPLHNMPIPASLCVVGRAGAGTNNIPVEELTHQGIPVLNTPGANANAVKELVITGMLLACRHICPAWEFMKNLSGNQQALHQQVEANKKQFVGTELPGKTLGVIGLGSIGIEVANTARYLGMNVIGYDPALSVHNAWKLRSSVKHADQLTDVLKEADFITLHVPLLPETKHLIDSNAINMMKKNAILLNFSRADIVEESAIKSALESDHLQYYVTDFPYETLNQHPRVITLPHLGASTEEAQENCAIMVAEHIASFLEEGHITHSVNFPSIRMNRNGDHRLTIVNQNIPNMVAQISTILSEQGLNILDMINKSRDPIAYTLIDVDSPVSPSALRAIESIQGVIRVRYLSSTLTLESV